MSRPSSNRVQIFSIQKTFDIEWLQIHIINLSSFGYFSKIIGFSKTCRNISCRKNWITLMNGLFSSSPNHLQNTYKFFNEASNQIEKSVVLTSTNSTSHRNVTNGNGGGIYLHIAFTLAYNEIQMQTRNY